MLQNIDKITSEIKTEKIKQKLLIITTLGLISGFGALGWNNKLMVAHINAKNIKEPSNTELSSQAKFARISVFGNKEDELKLLPNNCGARAVHTAIKSIEDINHPSRISKEYFDEFQNKNIGSLGTSPGVMEIFLKNLEGLGVLSQSYDTSKLSQAQLVSFFIAQMKQKRVPVVLMKSGLGYHWASVNAIGKDDGGGGEVEFVEDVYNIQTGDTMRGVYVRIPTKEFYNRINNLNLPGLTPTTFIISLSKKTAR